MQTAQGRPFRVDVEGLRAVAVLAVVLFHAAVRQAGGRYADLAELFCPAAVCPVVVGNTLVYRDDNHIAPEYAAVVTPVIDALVSQALADG